MYTANNKYNNDLLGFNLFKNQLSLDDDIQLNFSKLEVVKKQNTILIIGAGTVGGSLIEILNDLGFEIAVIDNSELRLFYLREKYLYNDKIRFFLCSIRDRIRVERIIKITNPGIIIHTAAYKHVSLLEENEIYEAIRTNIEGTVNLMCLAEENSVNQLIYLTTDKAVNPISKMGKTKRVAEMYLESKIDKSSVNVKILRFGNIINSSGSLIPVVHSRINKGLDIIVRGENTTRYFVLLSVVIKSIINLFSIKYNGSFLINMGKPILILDLVNELLLKYENHNCKIKTSPLNKGEKMNEELCNVNESLELNFVEGLMKINKNYYNSPKKIESLIDDNKKFESVIVEKIINQIIFDSMN